MADSFSPLSPKQRGKGDQGDGQGGQGGNQDDAIRRYTTGSEALNRYLRTTDKSKYSKADREKFDKEAADVSAALEKYPPVPGKSWRGAPAGDWLDKTKKDGLFSDPAFMSTSTSEGAASRFKSIATGAFSGNKSDGVMISIDGKNGRDISGGSSLAHQKEVLFDQGTLFKVKDKRKEDDTTYLDLEELT
ncbi:ADP-ribosyltransferase [Glycomyces buryatensis]|uniref:ADP-ribosyltransferase n=1 Tax=Glycomyces buryatensis TaxID=2570927 RepID=UPI001456284A|nr:ADP-ribosyltransferase [Glycomyces buryatensis]